MNTHDPSATALGSRDRDDESVPGALVVNADDWGRDRPTTDRMLECLQHGSVSSVSAMVFMEDSQRSAAVARETGIDAGLHLNLTTPFSDSGAPARLVENQQRLSRYLRRHRFAPIVFHPGLRGAFEYVVRAQIDEYVRLYGTAPDRIDGHHHMHLSANVVSQKLLPAGTIVRRNFTFRRGEKGLFNRVYRAAIDRRLARRHSLVDHLYTLPPIGLERVQGIVSLAHQGIVELEVHPIVPEEYQFLKGTLLELTGDVAIRPFAARSVRRRLHGAAVPERTVRIARETR